MSAIYDSRKSPVKNAIELLISKSQRALSSIVEAVIVQLAFYLNARLDVLEVNTLVAASFTASTFGKYAVDTSAGAVTVTLPATPSIGDSVMFSDASGTFDTNNLTVTSTSKIDSSDSDKVVAAENAQVKFIYINATIGWKSFYTAAATGSTAITGTLSTTGVATFSDATDATSSTAGGTIISGGLAVAKKINVGTDAAVGGALTVTGAATLGATSITAATPSLTTATGQTNTGFISVLGKTSGGWKRTTADATAYLVTETLAAQTVGTAALTIPDFAGVADEYTFKTKAQEMANKTLVAQVVKTGLTASGSAANDFSGSTGTFKTSTGLNTVGGKQALKVIATPVAAAGAGGGVAGATALGSANIVTISSDGATKGVKLLTGVAGDVIQIINTSGTAANLFAASGGTINGGAADAGCAVPASKGVIAICTAADTWSVFDMTALAGAAA